MSEVFHFLTHSGCLSHDYGGILPSGVTVTSMDVYVDGNLETNTAVSGSTVYLTVQPGQNPTTEDQRVRRRLSTR